VDSRTASHVLARIAAFLELKGENAFKVRAYDGAATALRSLSVDDLGPPLRSGELGKVRGLGPATIAVIRDLVETGESRYLEQLRESTPDGLVDMLEVPGLTPPRIRTIYETLNIYSIEELEAAARDGRLATLPKMGPKTVEKILNGIAKARERGSLQLYHHAAPEAYHLLEGIRSHPHVVRAELAGDIRRRLEIAGRTDVVAACTGDPTSVAQSFTRLPGVRGSTGAGAIVTIQFVDGAHLQLICVPPERFGVGWLIATGSDAHLAALVERLAARGVSIQGDTLTDARGVAIPTPDEEPIYRAAGLAYIEPELREGLGETDVAATGALPQLVTAADIRGVLHCHTHYSDGKASVREMASAAQARGWSYIGITDHSAAAAFAGGMSRDKVLAQREEIDELNTTLTDFRILKGIEADILVDGQLDDRDDVLDGFDFVIGSVHSRFSMSGAEMTARVLRALDDPRLTVLGHPTGRLLLARDPYALDMTAVLEKAVEVGAAVELNADPKRLDLHWRHLREAKALGATIEIGPDAHSTKGLDYMDLGIGVARKGWLERRDVLNTRSADDVLAFARARRENN
jgi:DNA polymerase (family 10)